MEHLCWSGAQNTGLLSLVLLVSTVYCCANESDAQLMRPQGFKNSLTALSVSIDLHCVVMPHLSLTAMAAKTLSPSNSPVTETFWLSPHPPLPSLFEVDMIVAACLSWKSDSFVALSGSTFYSKIIVHLIF